MRYVDVTLFLGLFIGVVRWFNICCFAYIMHLFRETDLYRVSISQVNIKLESCCILGGVNHAACMIYI